MTLSESTTGIHEANASFADTLEQSGGGGDVFTPITPRYTEGAAPDAATYQTFGPSTITGAASSAASAVSTTLSGAAASVKTGATGLWAKLTGKNTVSATLPQVNITASASGAQSGSFTWLWVALACAGAYLVYHFTKGKKGSKSFFKPRASGSVVKFRGK